MSTPRSPTRNLEKSIHGGLGKGNIGVLASRKGVGKTATGKLRLRLDPKTLLIAKAVRTK